MKFWDHIKMRPKRSNKQWPSNQVHWRQQLSLTFHWFSQIVDCASSPKDITSFSLGHQFFIKLPFSLQEPGNHNYSQAIFTAIPQRHHINFYTMTNTPSNKRKSTVLPRSTVDYLKNWMMSPEHIAHPYPTEKEKAEIMVDTGIELKQLTNWFVNNRKRFWKPRVEARLQQQIQAHTVAPSIASRPQSIGSKFFDFF